MHRTLLHGLLPVALLVALPFFAIAGETEDGGATDAPPAGDSAQTPSRQPVPPQEALVQAKSRLDEVFGEQLESDEPEDLSEAAMQLQEVADESEDPAVRFAALRTAAEALKRGGDAEGALQAFDQLSRDFRFDATPHKLEALEAAAKAKGRDLDGADAAILGESLLALSLQAMRAGNGEVADNAAREAYLMAGRAKDKALKDRATQRKREIYAYKREAGDAEDARKALAANPDDPKAHETLGRFLALWTGDWEAALPHLAQSTDEKLKAMAGTAAASPTLPAVRLTLANMLYGLGQEQEGLCKLHAWVYAAKWYRLAEPDLEGALDKALTEKRLDEIAELTGGLAQPAQAPVAVGARRSGLILKHWSKHSKTWEVHEVWTQPLDGRNLWLAKTGSLYTRLWGFLKVPRTGEYTFQFTSSGNWGVLKVNKQIVYQMRNRKQGGDITTPIALKAGIYPIFLQSYSGDRISEPTFKITWGPSAAKQSVIPADAFYHDPADAEKVGVVKREELAAEDKVPSREAKPAAAANDSKQSKKARRQARQEAPRKRREAKKKAKQK